MESQKGGKILEILMFLFYFFFFFFLNGIQPLFKREREIEKEIPGKIHVNYR